MLRKSNYVLFKFQANLLILKNLLRIGPARCCNICMRGLKLPENYTFNSKKRKKLNMSIIFSHFLSFFYLLAGFCKYDSEEIKDTI